MSYEEAVARLQAIRDDRSNITAHTGAETPGMEQHYHMVEVCEMRRIISALKKGPNRGKR